jgi:hypothetical protein
VIYADLTPEQKKKRIEANRVWREANPEKVSAAERRYWAKNRDKLRAKNKNKYWADPAKHRQRAKEWAQANPERTRQNVRKAAWRRAGIDVAAAEATLAAHSGLCDCCGTTRPGGRWGWNLDHDHSTGKVRGVLCHNCNTAIGKLGDTLDGVMNAVRYLSKGATQ